MTSAELPFLGFTRGHFFVYLFDRLPPAAENTLSIICVGPNFRPPSDFTYLGGGGRFLEIERGASRKYLENRLPGYKIAEYPAGDPHVPHGAFFVMTAYLGRP